MLITFIGRYTSCYTFYTRHKEVLWKDLSKVPVNNSLEADHFRLMDRKIFHKSHNLFDF